MSHQNYEDTLLAGWEDVHKKGQLSLWIFLSLKDGPKHMGQMKTFIESMTRSTITADDKSMYRALRRFHDTDVISYTQVASESGPDHKVYQLTPIGKKLLKRFVGRNFTDVLLRPDVQDLLQKP